MIITSEATNRAVARLGSNPDFKLFLEWVEEERSLGLDQLLETVSPVLVHQMQGSTRTLVDILRAVMLAPIAVAGISGRRNT